MSTNTLYYHMNKWGWKGMKADRAQQLLDEMAIDKVIPMDQSRGLGAINEAHQEEMVKIDPLVEAIDAIKVLREKDISDVPAIVEVSTAKDQEIERLRNELDEMIGQRNRVESQSNNMQALAKIELEKWSREYAQLSVQLDSITQEREDYKQATEDLESKIDRQKALVRPIAQLDVVPTPPNKRHFMVETQGNGAKVGGDLEALMRYVKSFNNEFHLEVRLNEIALIE